MKNLNLFVEHAINALSGDKETVLVEKQLAKAALRKAIYEKSLPIINEDHEEVMTTKEMVKYLKGLWKKADSDDKKAKFLAKLGKSAGVKDCSEKDLQKCAESLCAKGKESCDSVIHALEKIVGVKFKKEEVKEGYSKTSCESKKEEKDDDEDESDDEDDDDSDDDEKDSKKKSKKKDDSDDADNSDDDKNDKKNFFKNLKKKDKD
jgi:hypothetical protein